MIVRIKDITGATYKFDDVSRALENRTQIILRFYDKSEMIFTKKNIIYSHNEYDTESEAKHESI